MDSRGTIVDVTTHQLPWQNAGHQPRQVAAPARVPVHGLNFICVGAAKSKNSLDLNLPVAGLCLLGDVFRAEDPYRLPDSSLDARCKA